MNKIPSDIVHDAVEGTGKDRQIAVDLSALAFMQRRLTIADFGLMQVQIARAASSKNPSELQRLLLALVVHTGETHHVEQ